MRTAFVVFYWITLGYQLLVKGDIINSFLAIGIGIVGELMFIRLHLEDGLTVHHRNPLFMKKGGE